MEKKTREELEAESRFSLANRERKTTVTLGGTSITESGKLSRSDYFRFIGHDLDEYDRVEMSPEEAKKIHTHLQKLSTGTSAMVPLYCGGESCPFKNRCPLFQMNKHPLGKQCLIEVQLIKEYSMRYFQEFDVDPNNFTEVAFINELASLDIREMRMNMMLARPENADGTIDQVTAIGQDGTPILQKQISPYIEQLEKISTRRSKLIKLMVGDRQEKYKKEAALKIKMDTDPSSQMASMRSKLENLQRSMDNLKREAEAGNGHGGLTPQDIIDGDDK